MVVSAGGLHLYFKHPIHEVKTGKRVASIVDVNASGLRCSATLHRAERGVHPFQRTTAEVNFFLNWL